MNRHVTNIFPVSFLYLQIARSNEAVGDGAVGDGAVGDGTVGDGAVGDGTVGDGAVGDGAVGDHHVLFPEAQGPVQSQGTQGPVQSQKAQAPIELLQELRNRIEVLESREAFIIDEKEQLTYRLADANATILVLREELNTLRH